MWTYVANFFITGAITSINSQEGPGCTEFDQLVHAVLLCTVSGNFVQNLFWNIQCVILKPLQLRKGTTFE
jgi:hypothetical protein